MSTPFLGEIRIMSFNFPPKGWALCNGQLLPINQNQALFSLFGTMYGGNGQNNFALPNLQSRMPISFGNGFTQGEASGQESHTLILGELPQHTHFISATDVAANLPSPVGNFFANAGSNTVYAASPTVAMNPAAVTAVGGSQAHNNTSPLLVLNFCVALQGIFPSRN